MISDTESDQEVIKVIIADDQPMIRKMLQLQLATETSIKVIACADNGIKALEKIAEFAPDLILIDLEMPAMDGITAIKEICDRFPQTKALVLSSHDEREYINQAIMAGAKGYLLKGTSTKDLVNSIHYIHQGYFQLGSGLLDKISLSASEASRSLVESLSRYDLDSQQLSDLESKLTNTIKNIIELQSSKNHDKLSFFLEENYIH